MLPITTENQSPLKQYNETVCPFEGIMLGAGIKARIFDIGIKWFHIFPSHRPFLFYFKRFQSIDKTTLNRSFGGKWVGIQGWKYMHGRADTRVEEVNGVRIHLFM